LAEFPLPAVEAEDVGFSYRGKPALEGVSFAVRPGEIFGFLGPNGGGKSTLFRILATLAAPERGTVRVFGHDVAREARAVRRLLGVVFQHPGLDRELTVGENLIHHGHLYGLAGAELGRRIDAALARFGLGERKKQKVKELSGGLARRTEIAKALLPEPRLLLLDEPSTGLDPGARSDLAALLTELAAGGVTVLLTTHFMEEADKCHRLALLDRGKVVALGTPADLKAEVGGDVVTLTGREPQALAAAVGEHFPDLAPTLREGMVQFSREKAHEWVARLAEALPGRIETITVSRPSLEDVFLARTGRRLSGDGGAAAVAAAVGAEKRKRR
jgi:ABC-2 type transport system ATP-binding protein